MANSTTKKVLKIIGIIVACILLIAIGALLYINHNVGKIADGLVVKAFAESDMSKVYHMGYKSLSVNILSGNIKLTKFKVSPRDDFYTGSDSLRLANPILVDALIPEFVIRDLDIGAVLNFNDLSLVSIEIDNPQIKLITHLTKDEKDRLRKMLAKTVADSAKKEPALHHIELDKFRIDNGKFMYYSHLTERVIFEADRIDVDLRKVNLLPGKPVQTLLNKSFEKSSIQLKDIYYPVASGFYDIRLGEIYMSVEDNGFELRNIEVIPKYSKTKFGKAFGSQTDRFDVMINKVEFVGIEFDMLIAENKIEIERIVLTDVDANLYRDKNIAFDTTKYPPLPHQILGQIKQYMNIGKIEIKNSKLVYEELLPGAEIAGRVSISEMFATIYNVTNRPEIISKKGSMKWVAQGKLFGVSLLSLKVDFPADLIAFSFKFRGSLAKMDMSAFNPYTKSNLRLEIMEGTVDSMFFHADAGNQFSTGTMVMTYHGVKVKVLKEYNEEKEKKMGFLSGLANTVIRSNNPQRKSDKPPVPSEIFFVPNKHKTIINHMVKSLINGFMGTLVPAAAITREKYEKKQKLKKEVQQVKRDTRQQKKETKTEERQRKRKEKKDKS